MAPRNTEELVVWYAILGTYPAYFTGMLYVMAPVVGWCLLLLLVKRSFFYFADSRNYCRPDIHWVVWLWVAGMLCMELALIVGQLNHQFGLAQIIKSSIGWAKGWALLAVFILVGCLQIRAVLIIRACALVCVHTLFLIPVVVIAWVIGFSEVLFISPAKVIGGPGPEFFEVRLYEIDPSSGLPRWRLFTPWAPALGMVANIYFIVCLQEKNVILRNLALFASILMVLMSFSRLGIIVLFLTSAVVMYLSLMSRPLILWLSGVGAIIVGIAAPVLLAAVDFAVEKFHGARAGSSRVRSTLAEISVARWREEAPIWGHGVMERGPHLVEYMMIGSHHTWFGLLYVKGVVGFLAMAVPLMLTFLCLWWRSFREKTARIGLAVVLIMFAYSFGENLEILAYLFWPGLVLIGVALRSDGCGSKETEQALVGS